MDDKFCGGGLWITEDMWRGDGPVWVTDDQNRRL